MVTGIGSLTTGSCPAVVGGTGTPQTMPPADPVKRSSSDNRRSNKPIMEKRRRARINNCLNELKALILDATKKDPARHSKLEKADILEKTVKHLQELQRQQTALSQAADPTTLNKFKAGFAECANEVGRFAGLEPAVKRRLLQHLGACIGGVKGELQAATAAAAANKPTATATAAVQVHILPSPPSSPEQQELQQHRYSPHQTAATTTATQITATPGGYFLTNGAGTAGVQLIPTKLANGTIAFVLPQSAMAAAVATAMPLPLLIPIPSRTASTASAASQSSCSEETATSPCYATPPSPANSYEAMDTTPAPIEANATHPDDEEEDEEEEEEDDVTMSTAAEAAGISPGPLSLVMKKFATTEEDDDGNGVDDSGCDVAPPPPPQDDEKPWRPW